MELRETGTDPRINAKAPKAAMPLVTATLHYGVHYRTIREIVHRPGN